MNGYGYSGLQIPQLPQIEAQAAPLSGGFSPGGQGAVQGAGRMPASLMAYLMRYLQQRKLRDQQLQDYQLADRGGYDFPVSRDYSYPSYQDSYSYLPAGAVLPAPEAGPGYLNDTFTLPVSDYGYGGESFYGGIW